MYMSKSRVPSSVGTNTLLTRTLKSVGYAVALKPRSLRAWATKSENVARRGSHPGPGARMVSSSVIGAPSSRMPFPGTMALSRKSGAWPSGHENPSAMSAITAAWRRALEHAAGDVLLVDHQLKGIPEALTGHGVLAHVERQVTEAVRRVEDRRQVLVAGDLVEQAALQAPRGGQGVHLAGLQGQHCRALLAGDR